MNGAGVVVKSSLTNVGGRWLRQLGLAVLLVGVLCAMFGAVQASAFDRYQPAGFVPGPSGLGKAAVDDASGNLLVVSSGANEILVYGPSSPGGFDDTQIASFGFGQLSSPYGIAIDQSNGDVYVSDAGNERIARFTTDGLPTPTYTLDATYTGPSAGSDPLLGQIGSFESALAIDPADGDLLVADSGNHYVSRFEADGTFVRAFDGADSEGGAFQHPVDVAVGGGTTYVLDSTDPSIDPETALPRGTSRIVRFDADGVAQGLVGRSVGEVAKAQHLAYGSASGSLFVSNPRVGFPPPRLVVFRNDAVFQMVEYVNVNPPLNYVVGLAVDGGGPGASGRLYGITDLGLGAGTLSEVPGIQLIDRLQLPDASVDSPTNVTTTSMHLSGTVDSVKGEALFHFEYCLASEPCSSFGFNDPNAPDPANPWAIAADESPHGGSVTGIATAEASLAGLARNSAYLVRLVATNEDGTNSSEARTFSTLESVPDVVTGTAAVKSTAANLRGTVNPLGAQTGYHFEYGTTTAYGSQAPAGHEAPAGNGRVPLDVTQDITGLQPGTTYHYRLVAEDNAGEEVGADRTFTTLAAGSAPQRAYEMVSPAEKGGNIIQDRVGMQASEDGNTLTFAGRTVLGAPAESAPLYPRYVAQRSAAGWSTSAAVDPPQAPLPLSQESGPIKLTFGVSEDGTKAVVISLKKLAPGATDGDSNIYLRDVATGALTTMASAPGDSLFLNETYTFTNVFVQGTKNFDHVLLFAPGVSFLPGVPNGALYDFTGGQLHVVGLDQNGDPVKAGGIGITSRGTRVISPDGSRIVFGGSGRVYYRAGGVTRALTESRRTSDAGTQELGRLFGSSRDLRYTFFFSHDLTDDSAPGLDTLYRYDSETDQLQMLTRTVDLVQDVAEVAGLQVGSDGSTVVFAAPGVLTPDAVATTKHLYIWRDGELSLLAPLDGALDQTIGTVTSTWWLSPNGRYFTFYAATKLTDTDTASTACNDPSEGDSGFACHVIYRYDADTGQTICVSCRPDGKAPTNNPNLGPDRADLGTHQLPRVVTDKGQVFFASTEKLVSSDTNSTWDVYEYDDATGLTLISTGHGGPAKLAEVSADGRDVFFTTSDRLLKADTDTVLDIYDARVGGGIASQGTEVPSVTCSGEDCLPAAAAPPGEARSGSEAISGPGNAYRAKQKKCGKGFKVRKVKGKQRCVKQHKANKNRRQGR